MEQFRETPQSMSDVVVSRFKMSQVEPERAAEHLTTTRDAMQTLMDRDWSTADQREWLDLITTALAELESDSD